jgi:hypothetical protein
MSRFWRALEDLRGPAGVAALWQRWVGSDFDPLRAAFLRARPQPAASVPCPRDCGCAHRIVRHAEGRLTAVCRCEPWNCDDLNVTEADLIVYELSWSKLSRAIARAFGAEVKEADLGVKATRQVAAFGSTALPVVLTLQRERPEMRSAVGQLGARLRERFVLLAPTSRALDAAAHGWLANAKAGFSDLESHLALLPSGHLLARRGGGELFTPYLGDEPKPMQTAEARRVFALFTKLASEGKIEKAPLDRVFRLAVLEGHSQRQVAQRCGCVPPLISRRIQTIEARFGLTLEQLRYLASEVLDMETSVKGRRSRGRYADAPMAGAATAADAEPGDEDADGDLPEERTE